MQKFMIVVNSTIKIEIIYFSIQNSDKFMLCDIQYHYLQIVTQLKLLFLGKGFYLYH